VIRLHLIGAQAEVSLADVSAYFRITGGVVCTRPEYGPFATYSEERWRHREVLWSSMRFEGQCRLVFGLPRDPARISEQLQSLSIDESCLHMTSRSRYMRLHEICSTARAQVRGGTHLESRVSS
jgi:hypothetical protein